MAKKNNSGRELITKELLLGDIIRKHPETVETMLSHGMHCVGCHVATWESLEQASKAHGIDTEKLLKDLNNTIKGGKK